MVPHGPLHREEIPPIPVQPNLRLIDSIWTQRVLIDDETQALYKREDSGTEFYYELKNPLEHSLIEEKVLYVFVNGAVNALESVFLVDKYGQEWNLRVESDVRGFTYLGRSITMLGQGGASTSKDRPHMPILSASPMPPPSTHKVHFMNGFVAPSAQRKPMNSVNTYTTSGHPANRGPTRPLHTPSCNTPLVLPKRKPTVSTQVITRDQAQANREGYGKPK